MPLPGPSSQADDAPVSPQLPQKPHRIFQSRH